MKLKWEFEKVGHFQYCNLFEFIGKYKFEKVGHFQYLNVIEFIEVGHFQYLKLYKFMEVGHFQFLMCRSFSRVGQKHGALHENDILMCLSYLVYLFIDQITDINVKDVMNIIIVLLCMIMNDIALAFYQLVCFYIYF